MPATPRHSTRVCVRRVPADAYLFLNPDVELSPGCVAALARGLSEPGVGVAAPRQQDERGRLSFSLRREPTLGRAIGEAVLGGRRAGRVDSFGEMVVDPSRYLRPAHVAWASGSVLLIDARCLAEVGEWDESFFLYSEETDFLLRAGDSGFRVRYCPDAVAHPHRRRRAYLAAPVCVADPQPDPPLPPPERPEQGAALRRRGGPGRGSP